MVDISSASQPQIASNVSPSVDQTVLRHSPNVQSASMGEETVLLDLSTGRYYTLNRVGTSVWELLTGHNTISDIHVVLCHRFEVDSEQAWQDLLTLVNQLVEEGLVQQEGR